MLPILLLVDANINFKILMNPEDTPTYTLIILQFTAMTIGEDLMFYISHRLLHTSMLYKIHKIHHEYTTTVSIAAIHSHWL